MFLFFSLHILSCILLSLYFVDYLHLPLFPFFLNCVAQHWKHDIFISFWSERLSKSRNLYIYTMYVKVHTLDCNANRLMTRRIVACLLMFWESIMNWPIWFFFIKLVTTITPQTMNPVYTMSGYTCAVRRASYYSSTQARLSKGVELQKNCF